MPGRVSLDDTDHAILELLRLDARRTVADIAARVNLSAAPVARRIDRLEKLGVIRGYTTLVDYEKVGPALEAFVELRFVGSTDVHDILDSVTRLPEVREAFTMAGDPDAMVRLRVDDVAHLQRAVNDLRRSGNVTGTKTLIVLERRTRARERAARGRAARATGRSSSTSA